MTDRRWHHIALAANAVALAFAAFLLYMLITGRVHP
jgi:hypothetical protein